MGCHYNFDAKLVPGGEPQAVKCSAKPGTELTQSMVPTSVGMDFKVMMQDLTAYIYNPAVVVDCEY